LVDIIYFMVLSLLGLFTYKYNVIFIANNK